MTPHLYLEQARVPRCPNNLQLGHTKSIGLIEAFVKFLLKSFQNLMLLHFLLALLHCSRFLFHFISVSVSLTTKDPQYLYIWRIIFSLNIDTVCFGWKCFAWRGAALITERVIREWSVLNSVISLKCNANFVNGCACESFPYNSNKRSFQLCKSKAARNDADRAQVLANGYQGNVWERESILVEKSWSNLDYLNEKW